MSSEVSWKPEHKLIDLEEKPKYYKSVHQKTNWLPLSAVHGYSSGMKVSLTITVNCLAGCFNFDKHTYIM